MVRAEKEMDGLREKALQAVRDYYKAAFGQEAAYAPGERIGYGGRIFDEEELVNLTESVLDFGSPRGGFVGSLRRNLRHFWG